MGPGPGHDADRPAVHVRYTLRGTPYLLHRIGFTPQVPAYRAVERDEDAAVAVILSLVKGLTPLSGRKVGV